MISQNLSHQHMAKSGFKHLLQLLQLLYIQSLKILTPQLPVTMQEPKIHNWNANKYQDKFLV